MNPNNLTWEHVAPHVVHPRQSRELGTQRAAAIAAFVRQEVPCDHVEVELRGAHGPGPEYGSCTRFLLFFDEAWRPIDGNRERRRYSIDLSVSEQGPFITSGGVECQWQRQPWDGGIVDLVPNNSDSASARAKALALQVAAEFGLRYVDANWLRGLKLSPKELPWDDVGQSLDIDHDEPTALNILFNEEL